VFLSITLVSSTFLESALRWIRERNAVYGNNSDVIRFLLRGLCALCVSALKSFSTKLPRRNPLKLVSFARESAGQPLSLRGWRKVRAP